jgi:GntR family phosphonate transport system transcriptional regulator
LFTDPKPELLANGAGSVRILFGMAQYILLKDRECAAGTIKWKINRSLMQRQQLRHSDVDVYTRRGCMQQLQDIDRSNGSQPVYRQISQIIKDDIRNHYMAGDMLPSEHALARRFHVNRHTVRRAMDELIHAGHVDRVRGKGTFVMKPAVDYAIHSATRFTETLQSQGRRTVSQVLDNSKEIAHGKIAKKLKLPHGAPIIHLKTMRTVDTLPFCVSNHYFPSPVFEQHLNSYRGGSLHRFIADSCGKRLRRVGSLIMASMPEKEDAMLLCLPCDTAILKVESVNVERPSNVPAEYVVTRFRGDAIQLSIKP